MKKLKLNNSSYKALLIDFKNWLDILGYSKSSVYYLPVFIQEFMHWLETQNINSIDKISLVNVKAYYKYLGERSHERKSGALSKAYLNKHQQALKKFREYLKKHNPNITFKVHLKWEDNDSTTKAVLTLSEIKALFETTNYSSPFLRTRLRDKAMLVLLYSCGLRRSEAMYLDIKDILFDKQLVFIKKSKNFKQRYVPLNDYNLSILEDYLYDGRPLYTSTKNEALLINKYGNRMHGNCMATRLRYLIKLTNNKTIQDKHITPHSLRHSIATHLLQQHVKLEDIQQFLGHSSLESTTIYTHLIEQL